jgi:flagellar hook-associated protein 3 FlgL
MRISTLQFYKNSTNLLLNRQQSILEEQQKIATGKRIQSPSDDPVASARISLLESRISRNDRFISNAEFAQSTLNLADSNLQVLDELGFRLKEIQVRSISVIGNDAKQALATEVEQILEQMLAISNSKDQNGNYIYGGSINQQQPFQKSGTTVFYNGDDSQRKVNISNDLQVPVSDSGYDIFMNIKSADPFAIATYAGFDTGVGQPEYAFREVAGNVPFSTFNATNTGTAVIDDVSVTDPDNYIRNIDNYFIRFDTAGPTTYTVYDSDGNTVQAATTYTVGTPIEFNGLSITLDAGTVDNGDNFHIQPPPRESTFDTVQRMITNLNREGTTPAERDIINEENDSILFQIDEMINHFTNQLTLVGSRQNNIDRAQQFNDEIEITSKQTISLLEDTDMVEAITKLNGYTVSLQAAQQSFARVQQLSLFNFI